jgi:pyruvate oxidase
MDACDLLIMVGSDFPYRDFYPKSGSMIQIDIEPTQIGKRRNVDIGLVGHAGPTLAALTGLVNKDRSEAFLKSHQDDMRRMLQQQQLLETSEAVPIAPPRVLNTLGKLAPDDAIFLCDTGTVTAWSARHLRLKPKQRYTLSGGLASMAFAFSGAIGAQLAYPQRRVFALAGDGAFAMLMGDFITAVKYDLPIVVIVLNNRKLAFIALEQNVKGLPEWGTELKNADFAAVARACGGLGLAVERPEDLEPAIKLAVASEKPTVIDIAVDPDALIMPPEVKLPQAVGFTFAKLREFFGE